MDDLVDPISLGPEILTELGEDFVRALSVPDPRVAWGEMEKDCVNRISEVVSRARGSPTGPSPQDAKVLAEMLSEVCSFNRLPLAL